MKRSVREKLLEICPLTVPRTSRLLLVLNSAMKHHSAMQQLLLQPSEFIYFYLKTQQSARIDADSATCTGSSCGIIRLLMSAFLAFFNPFRLGRSLILGAILDPRLCLFNRDNSSSKNSPLRCFLSSGSYSLCSLCML
jgi:hypothetical protein